MMIHIAAKMTIHTAVYVSFMMIIITIMTITATMIISSMTITTMMTGDPVCY